MNKRMEREIEEHRLCKRIPHPNPLPEGEGEEWVQGRFVNGPCTRYSGL